MNAGTQYVSFDKTIIDSKSRASSGMDASTDNDEMSATGWTWTAALIIAALFIVSGYMDQESKHIDASSASVNSQKYVANAATTREMTSSVNVGLQREKGY